ncbi:hypothetical protein [Acetobacterium carbinolicum]|uniref:hypothetical protein n=1 Tax=Acetobacterium carbinolicum TaxID=52690 RepID=UPI0039C9EEDA
MLKVGTTVLVTTDKKKKKGKVFYENDHFICVQFKNYKECFLKIDIRFGLVKAEVLS